ncbi:MAG: O-antigen ligase family protein [Pirellulales bacterium]|nr:O-antigen ligase family protein [Pirellulales bacterium]
MSLKALIWIGLFVSLSTLSFRRSSWAVPLYLLTYYAGPANWWWGSGALTSTGIRWNLMAAMIFAAAVLFDGRRRTEGMRKPATAVFLLMLLYALNASAVHFLYASDPIRSWLGLQLLWKRSGLLLLMLASVRNKFDLRILVISILIGSAYIGYEVVLNAEGHYLDGRLEGIGIAGASEANAVAQILCVALPLGAYLLFHGNKMEKPFALASLVLVLEVIQRCVSRAASLALIGAAAWLIVRARGRVRRQIIGGVALGVLGVFILMGEVDRSRNIARLATVLAGTEERDESAQSRIYFWEAALAMVQDHPFGWGFEATETSAGTPYLRDVGVDESHAIHNGYLDIAVSWGVQGLALYLAVIFLAWRSVHASISLAYSAGDESVAFFGHCIEAVLLTQLVSCMFASTLDAEVVVWWIALAATYPSAFPSTKTETCEQELGEVSQSGSGKEEPLPHQTVLRPTRSPSADFQADAPGN